jgi:hypothetical protein
VTARDIGMVPLGYGKYARASDIVALIPIGDGDRGHGRRTYVHVAGLDAPVVASRSESAILADMERAATNTPPSRPVTADGRVRAPRRWRRATARA